MSSAMSTSSSATAVKACIIQDVHKPNTWDIPGGRLSVGENPYEGLKRETQEEVGLEIDIQLPVDVQFFTRDDGQQITMLIFLCLPLTTQVRLSAEHQAFAWKALTAPVAEFPEWLRPVVQRINQFGLLPRAEGV